MKRRKFSYKDKKSDKFWEIELNGKSYTTYYGKTGKNPRNDTNTYDSEEEAKKEYEKVIERKLNKGYKEMSEVAESSKNDKEGKASLEAFEKEFGKVEVDTKQQEVLAECTFYKYEEGKKPGSFPPLVKAVPYTSGFYLKNSDPKNHDEAEWEEIIRDTRLAREIASMLKVERILFSSEADYPVFPFVLRLGKDLSIEVFKQQMDVEKVDKEIIDDVGDLTITLRDDLNKKSRKEVQSLFWSLDSDMSSEIDEVIPEEEQAIYFNVTELMLKEFTKLYRIGFPSGYVNIPEFFVGLTDHNSLVGVYTIGVYT